MANVTDIITISVDIYFTAFFFVLFLLFIYQTTRKNRYAPHFIISLFFGFLGGLFSLFDVIFPSTGSVDLLSLIDAICFSLQAIFFFLFMENLRSLKLNSLRWSFTLVLFTIQIISAFGIAFFSHNPGFSTIAALPIFISNISYNLLAFYIFFIIGVPIYIKTYRYAKENRPLIMFIALILVGLGFLIAACYELLAYLGVNTFLGVLINTFKINYILPLIGLFLFLLCYITDVDYLYRLPNDNYILMVSYKSGVTIHTIRFKTRYRNVDIEENLLSGLITSVNMVFKSVLESQAEVQNILSEDATILMQSGKYVCATIVSDNVSAILDRSLRRYVQEFEKEFHEQLQKEDFLISDFDSAKDLLKSIFPYLVIHE